MSLQKDPSLKIVFQNTEDILNESFEKNDLEKIASILSEDWVILESSAGLSTKKEFINVLSKGVLVQNKMIKEVQWLSFFNEMAIVISKGKNKGIYKNKKYEDETWVTNIYRNENSEWRCIMTQKMPVECNLN